jgi:hypothetical protein
MRAAIVFLLMSAAPFASAATVSGGFEGSNVVYIQEVSANNFSCWLYTPPMAVPASSRYNNPGNHYHNWFMLKIEDAAGETVTVTINNADWGGGGDGMWGRADGKAVYSEAADPNALAAEGSWQKITNASYSSPDFTFTLTPSTNLAWVALHYPAMPTHTENWVAAQSASPYVTVETVTTTSQGWPVYMLFVTDSNVPLQDKRAVVIYGQEHMNEQTGGWTCQGAVEFLTSADPVAQSLRENVVFVIIPDLNPDATASGYNCDPDDGKIPQWRYNPAAVDRMMPGMIAPMTVQSRGIWNRLVEFVDSGGRIDFCFNIHQGGRDNFWGVYELADPNASNLDSFLRTYMPTSGAPWVPNTRQGYSRGGWQNFLPTGPFAMRLLGRCWEDWRTVPMGYEISMGGSSDNFITDPVGFKYFGEAIARATYDYYGEFGQTITVLGPNGGESLPAGSATVTWNSTGTVGNVRIDYSADGGASWSNLVASTQDDGSQNVTLPGADSTSCLIRVSSAAARGVSDRSDDLFTIGTPPNGSLTLTSPVGGEVWDTNWIDTVTWTSTGSVSNVRIELTTDNGSSWRLLAYSVPAGDGSYLINVPNTPSTQCRVSVTAVENAAVGDTSGNFFSIQTEPPWPTLTVTSPDGGEIWPPGGTATVTWSTTGTVGDVGISLSTDEGATWTSLIDSTPNDGSQTVSVPAVESSGCLVWVFDARQDPWLNRPDADPLDVSDGLFSISSAVCVTDADCNDNNVCTGTETCQGGSCLPGTPLDCGDANPCTDDLCDTLAGCSNPPNSDPCDDGDACTMNDACSQGACAGAPLDADSDTYISDACGGDDCDDSDGAVHPNAAEVCDDTVDNDCDGFTDAADPGCAACVTDADCDDSNACNGAETCQANACAPGTALDCDDSNICTTDSCDPVQGCQNIENDLPCDDGLYCNGAETCGGGQCNAGSDPCPGQICDEQNRDCLACATDADCDDDNVCTDDVCDPAQGCRHSFNTAPCDDGDDCTIDDICSNAACRGTIPDEVCDDGLDNDCDGDTDADDTDCGGGDDPGPSGGCSCGGNGGNQAGWALFGLLLFAIIRRASNHY